MLFQGPKTIKNQEQQKVSGIYVNVVDDYLYILIVIYFQKVTGSGWQSILRLSTSDL
jgi:hypothetical protein